ncbi:tubulin-like doman-containing protein [Georgenia sp. SYP-B2076]|uniref:tubulin-like doman-containing protein n=1 Tax=Georgenia sp. SYP-B2076 TaxID=2495881 RepID=UPI000F8CB82E|nr:tubulin-like doman-containing protein [Georgenia sp. SYP-B2076]
MLRPFLMIGVGGSGGKTLRVVRDDLLRRMEQLGWEGALPRAWQFIHIDVPTLADGNDPDLPAQLPPGDYQGLVNVGLTYRHIDAALAGHGRTPVADAMGTWRPDPGKVNIPASKGAGQYRALGRVITVAGLEDIREAVARARRALTGAEVVGELQRATRLLGATPAASTPDPVVLVVCSLAGGTGAGAVIDVCDTVRALGDPWASESIGLLYAPDVFDYLPEEQRRGVRPNSLATLGELLSGYWNTDGPGEETNDLLARHGIQLGAVNRLGPRYPFLVGNRNEQVSYGTQNDIYRAMGRSVASWVTSVTLQDRLGSTVQGNWSATAQSVTDHLPNHAAGTETPFTALGSARVGLGRDRFRDYAAEYLARSAVERVLRRHEELRLPDDERIERRLVADVAQDVFGSFLAESGLDERGEGRGDLLAALRPEQQVRLARDLADELHRRVTGGMPEKGLSSVEVRHRIVSETGARRPAFHDGLRLARQVADRAWVVAIQPRLADQTARSVSLHGGPVTAAMLAMLATELQQVREELREDAARYRRWAQGGEQAVTQEVEQGGATLTGSSPAILAGVRRAVESLVHQDEAELREMVADLVPDLVTNLVDPLREAVARGTSALAQEESSQLGGQLSPITLWPQADLVPERLNAAPNEFLLEPTSRYPGILRTLVGRTVESAEPGGAMREATTQVVLDTDDVRAGVQHLVRQETAWVPREHTLQSGIVAAPSRASFDVAASGEALLGRARRWLEREGTAVGGYIGEGLRDYLDPARTDPREHGARLAAFEGQFIAALNASAPLVGINPGVLVQVHDVNKAQHVLSFSEIPLPERSPGREIVRRVLQSTEQWSNDIAKAFGEGREASIDIFSVLATPYEPVVFDSLMKPIASEWGARNTTPDTRAEFWRWRRARSLTEALPLAPATRRAMVRGWFTARVLTQLDLTDRVPQIWVPDEAGGGGRYRSFPDPLLATDVVQSREILPVVLESILLAMVEVNTRASREPMAPYVRLRDLGRSGMGGGYDTYQAPSTDLRAWIRDGCNPVVPAPAGSTPQTRRQEVEAQLDRLHGNYARHFAAVDERTDVFDVPLSYDLRFDILAALVDLRRAVGHIEDDTEDDW